MQIAPTYKVVLNNYLRAERVIRGLSRQAVADAVGCTRAAVGHWETGLSRPSPKALKALRELYSWDQEEMARVVYLLFDASEEARAARAKAS